MNKKGFTLIELLAVIIILGVLFLIAIPSISKYIQTSREKTYLTNLQKLVDAVSTEVNTHVEPYSFSASEYLVIPFGCIELERGNNSKSPFSTYINGNSFVLVIMNEEEKKFEYYVSAKDNSGFGTEISLVDKIKIKVVEDDKIGVIDGTKITLGVFDSLVFGKNPKLVTCEAFEGESGVSLNNNLKNEILNDNQAQSDENIDFGAISSETNGKGLYYTSNNTEDNKVTYYFRGSVENNYVKFAGFYWRIVRINEDGSIRLIYQGKTPTATGNDTSIGTTAFNIRAGDNAYVGYMHGTTDKYIDGIGNYSGFAMDTSTGKVKLATSYAFNANTGEYTLINPVDGRYTSEYHNYYTCRSATNVTCKFMLKITETKLTDEVYENLWAGETHSGYFSTNYNETHSNIHSSTVKTVLDNWYKNNLLSYEDYIEDSGFCNDRSIAGASGVWSSVDTALGYGNKFTYYGASIRIVKNKLPQFECYQKRDLLTLNNDKGSKTLNYPIGLITADEVAYAGGVSYTSNNNYYLYNERDYWTISPFNFNSNYSSSTVWSVTHNGQLRHSLVFDDALFVRPVINLKSTVEITNDTQDGSIGKEYIIKTN